MRLIGVRGATTCDDDSESEILARTRELLEQILDENEIARDDLVSMVFTATDDLTAAFPAAAAREMGFSDVPLIGARELAVHGAVTRCIRVLIHCYSDKTRSDVRHIYIGGAKALRDDL